MQASVSAGISLRKRGSGLTLRQRLAGFSAILVLIAAVIGAVGGGVAIELSAQLAATAQTGSALRNHLEADMMHDALRGDVLSALRAGRRGSAGDKAEIEKDLAEHIDYFRARIAANQNLELSADVAQALESVIPSLEAYIASAQKTVGFAFGNGTDYADAAAAAEFVSFMESFRALEASMAKVSDKIEASARETEAAGRAFAAFAQIALIAVTLAAIGIAGLLSWALIRQICRPVMEMTASMGKLAGGDVTVTIPALGRTDEIGQMADAVQVFKESAIEKQNMGEERKEQERLAEQEKRRGMLDLADSLEASEVKSLANQTAKATEEIDGQIAAIQGSTDEAVNAIDGIGKIINELDEIAASGQVLTAAQGLSKQSGALRTEIDKFLQRARAA